MRTFLAILFSVCVSVSVVGARQAKQNSVPTVALPAELARVLTDYESAWQKRDTAALVRLFADDGFVLPNGHEPVRGRAAIEAFYKGQGGPLALRAIAYGMDGSVGYILGGFATRAGEPDSGKFTLTLRKGADGKWLIVSDMDSPNSQPRAPQP
jgi:ketosteroid isomerase-like protein